jgi:hypothetical protein
MVRRAFVLMSVSVVAAVVAGCREAPSSPSPERKHFSPAEQKAVDAAQAFLAKHGTDWGSPSQVQRAEVEYLPDMTGDTVYCVTYLTPDHELKQLGDRTVLVDLKSGRIEFLPRC